MPSKRRFVRPLAHVHIEIDYHVRTNEDVEKLAALFDALKKKKAEE